MFGLGGDNSAKKKGKQATKGEAQIAKDNAKTIDFYKKILTYANVVFIVVHFVFYFISGFSITSIILFGLSNAIAWYVWSFMRQAGTPSSAGGGITDLNLEGSISEYAKDIILTIVIAQSTSLLHRYFWWILSAIPLYAIYKAGKLYFFSPYAQLGAGGNADEDESADGKKGKRKVVRVARH